MSKKQSYRLRGLTICAMMAALSIIFERIITITPALNTSVIRIGISNIPIILVGIIVSPFAGAACGIVSDIVGCFLSGYPPFIPLTFAPLVMGFLPALLLRFMKKYGKEFSFFKIAFALTITHLLSSFVITTFGLCLMRGVSFIPMLVTRLPSCTANLILDIFVIYLLLKTPINKSFRSKK